MGCNRDSAAVSGSGIAVTEQQGGSRAYFGKEEAWPGLLTCSGQPEFLKWIMRALHLVDKCFGLFVATFYSSEIGNLILYFVETVRGSMGVRIAGRAFLRLKSL